MVKASNFGHFGHSIESFLIMKSIIMEAVILGMLIETYIAYRKGLIDYKYYDEIRET